MTERDHDIEFDFFEDLEPPEQTEERTRIVRRPGGPPRRPTPPTSIAPLFRLAGLIAFAILVVVLIVFAVRRCSANSKTHEYRSYIGQVSKLASASAELGKELNDKLTTPGVKERDLETALNGLAQQQQQDLARAQGIVPPGPLRPEHRHLIDALQLRATGLSRLRDAFRQTADSKDAAKAGETLAKQGQLLVASDVVWDFYFVAPASAELKHQGIGGVAVPDSPSLHFVQNPDLVTREAMLHVFQRIHGAATGGSAAGLHGTGLVSVKVLPSGMRLSTSSDNTIVASSDLAFEVAVQDTGDAQEVQIPVTLTIEKSPKNIVQRKAIDVLDPGETKTVVFKNLSGSITFARRTILKVDVTPVPNEKTKTNNSASYPVIFSLAAP
jgi:hypothetical protein